MSPLRMRMIEDMKLAGLSPGTQATYIDAVRKLAAYYRRSPDQLSEEEVRAYILHLRERGAARGTFKATRPKRFELMTPRFVERPERKAKATFFQ